MLTSNSISLFRVLNELQRVSPLEASEMGAKSLMGGWAGGTKTEERRKEKKTRVYQSAKQKGRGRIHSYCVATAPTDLEPYDEISAMNISSGYILRAKDRMPKHATTFPFAPIKDYVTDSIVLSYYSINDGVLSFRSKGEVMIDGERGREKGTKAVFPTVTATTRLPPRPRL